MHFDLVDAVLERSPDRIVTIKHVSAAEEYLQDHFPAFPVLPGVMMVEAMVQAARRLLSDRTDGRLVLGGVPQPLKYGAFVRPGDTLRVEVTLLKETPDGGFDLRGEGTVARPRAAHDATPLPPLQTAVSGRFALRPVRLLAPAAATDGRFASPAPSK